MGESASERVRLAYSSSLLGTYGWVRKTFQTTLAGGSDDSGSLPVPTREPEIGMGVAVPDSHDLVGPIQTIPAVLVGIHGDSDKPRVTPVSQFHFSDSIGEVSRGLAGVEQSENAFLEVQGSTQTAPAELLGSISESVETGAVPASQFKSPGPIFDFSNGLIGAEVTDSEFLKVQGGDFMVEVIHSGVKDKVLAPLVSSTPILVNGALNGPVEGQIAIPQQSYSAGMELVPFGEEEPIPLDWSHASEARDGSGSQATRKEDEVIFAFSQIVGVSCDGQFNRLREAIALILAGKSYKPGKNSVGGGKAKKKVCVNWITFTFQLIMMGEVEVCLIVEVREGGIEFVYEVQHIILERERAELPK